MTLLIVDLDPGAADGVASSRFLLPVLAQLERTLPDTFALVASAVACAAEKRSRAYDWVSLPPQVDSAVWAKLLSVYAAQFSVAATLVLGESEPAWVRDIAHRGLSLWVAPGVHQQAALPETVVSQLRRTLPLSLWGSEQVPLGELERACACRPEAKDVSIFWRGVPGATFFEVLAGVLDRFPGQIVVQVSLKDAVARRGVVFGGRLGAALLQSRVTLRLAPEDMATTAVVRRLEPFVRGIAAMRRRGGG